MATLVNRLSGKVAAITGGASGIGAATAKLFVGNGAKLVIADIQSEKGAQLAQALGPNAKYVQCDVTREEDVAAAVDFAVCEYGKLDIMFNNAGITGLQSDPFPQLNTKVFDDIFSVNVRGVLFGVKHASRVMVPAKKGCILCTASVASVVGLGMFSSYTISKHAVIGIVRAAASELGQHGIRVNSISPYAVPTGLTLGEKRPEQIQALRESRSILKGQNLEAEDIANMALFLASEEARYVSGQNWLVDGATTTCLNLWAME